MSEEQKDSVSEKEKDKSEKLIYVLTGLLVVVIFGAIAVLYFNPSADEKVYKPEKIQIVKRELNQLENKPHNISLNSNEDNKSNINSKDDNVKNNTNNLNQTVDKTLAKSDINTPMKKIIEEKNKLEKNSVEVSSHEEKNMLAKKSSENNLETTGKRESKNLNKSSKGKEQIKKEGHNKIEKTEDKKVVQLNMVSKEEGITKVNKKSSKNESLQKKYYYIQVGALASMEKARKEKAKFEKRGFKNIIVIKEKGLYKLLIGKFNSFKEAMEYKRNHNLKEGWIRIFKSPVN